MGFRIAKQFLKIGSSSIPKDFCTVYAGEEVKRRYVIPISYLKHPCFQQLLAEAEEEFGFHHPMGCLIIRCKDDIFNDLVSRLICSL